MSRLTEKLTPDNREYFRRPYAQYPRDDYRGMMSGLAFSLVNKETPGGVKHSEGIRPWWEPDVDYTGMEYQHPITYRRTRPRILTPIGGGIVPGEETGACPPIEIDSGPVWINCGGAQYRFWGVRGVPPFRFFMISGPGGINKTTGVYTSDLCNGVCDDDFLRNVIKVGMTDACRKKTFSSTSFFLRSPEEQLELNVACPACNSPVQDGDQVTVSGGTPPYVFSISQASISETGIIGDTTGECGTATVTVTDDECLSGKLDVRMPVGSWVLESSWQDTSCSHDVGEDVTCIYGATRLIQWIDGFDSDFEGCVENEGQPDNCPAGCPVPGGGTCAVLHTDCAGGETGCVPAGGGYWNCHCRFLNGEQWYTWECP